MKDLRHYDDSIFNEEIGTYDWIKEEIVRLEDSASPVDRESLVAFLIMEGKRDERALRSRLKQLILHLLKWKYQPDFQTRSWRLTIAHQREEIEDDIRDSKNLNKLFFEYANEVYESAKRSASRETGLHIDTFPKELEFTREQLLDFDFLPKGNE